MMTIAITTVLVLLLVGIDQLTKWLVLTYLKPINAVTVIDGILQFRYVENTGAAFGIFSENTLVLALVTSLIMIAVLLYIFLGKVDDKLECTALTVIVAGGVGNLIDRVVRGFVVDFIEFTFVDYAVFNVADIFVTVGVVLFVLYIIIDTTREIKVGKKEQMSGDDE